MKHCFNDVTLLVVNIYENILLKYGTHKNKYRRFFSHFIGETFL